MELNQKIATLYEKDTPKAYENLKALELVSEKNNLLYPYFDDFLTMLKSEKYVIRVREFRLLCKQAQWDYENKINSAIDDILNALHDEKPTAVRQYLQYLACIVPYKKELCHLIKEKTLSIDLSNFKDTMQPLIAKDIQHLLQLIEAQ